MTVTGETPNKDQKEKFAEAELEKILFSKIDILTESENDDDEHENDENVDWNGWQF